MIPVLLCVIFAVSAFMTVTASAATAGQDGVEAELIFSKTEYKAEEDLDATLTVRNLNPYPVHNVQTKIVLPEGMKLASGSLPSKAFTLAANETKTYEATLAKETVPDTPKKGSDPGVNPNSSKPAKTGDDSNIGILIALMLLSGGVLVFVMVRRKRLHGKGVIPFILCFIVLGAVMLPMTADAAGKQKEFTVGDTVKVDGKEVTVKAVVSYDYLVHSNVTVKNGTVDNGTGTGLYAEGETVTITAKNPDPASQHFSGWTVVSGGAVLADNKKEITTFKMPANDVEITANYVDNVYTIEATAGEGGDISPKGNVDVTHGEPITFTIIPKTGYHIKEVKVDKAGQGAITEYTFDKVTKPHTIEAVFEIDTFEIAVSAGEGGKIDPSSAIVNYGAKPTFKIIPDTGYDIKEVKVDKESKGAITEYTFEPVTKSHTIEATFAKKTFEITTTAGEGGNISPNFSTVEYGAKQLFNITPKLGYSIEEVRVDNESIGSVSYYEFTNVKEPHTISATFRISTSEELKNAVRGALDNGQTDIVIAGDLNADQQNAAGEALREWCKKDKESRQGTISLTLSDVIQVSENAFKIKRPDEASLKSLNLPQATTIGVEAFKWQQYLESVTVPKVEIVGVQAFDGCSSLSSFNWDKVKIIEGNAFYGCRTLKNVNLPVATTLGQAAFAQCDELESVTAPLVTEVLHWAFLNCQKLTSLTFGSAITSWGGGVMEFVPTENITLTLANGQKELTGGNNNFIYPNDTDFFNIADGAPDMKAGVNKEFCEYIFKEIKLTK